MTPKLDHRDMEALLDEIGLLADSYTPQWRLNRLMPDMGTALAMLFANTMKETVEDFNRVPELCYRQFMETAGCEVKGAEPARGYMTFGLVKPDMPEILLPAGWGVVSSGQDGCGSISMETEEEVYVSAASVSIVEICSRDGGRNTVPVDRDDNDYGESWPGTARRWWMLVFDRPLNQSVISLLFLLKQRMGGETDHLIWEYYGDHGWTSMPVEDGTQGLTHTGILKFAAASDLREYEEEVSEGSGLKGWCIRVRGGENDCLPGKMASVYMNGAAVTARDFGIRGNLVPGTKHRLKKTAGFVSVIRNPDYFSGGSDKESYEEASLRTSAGLRHQSRAVTPGDYERLVREACRDVAKVRCFPGYDEDGMKRWGAVTLVVLGKDFMEGQPYFFKIREQLLTFFGTRISETLAAGQGFFVTSPRFIRMDIKAVLCVRNMGDVMAVRNKAAKELDRFLNPVTGGSDGSGWDMGILPAHMQVKNCLQRVPDTVYIKQLSLLYLEEREGKWEETDGDKVSLYPWALPFPGVCRLDVEVG